MIIRPASLILLFAVCATCFADLSPKSRTVELQEFTRLVVNVTPDLGVQLVFPFILDSPKNNPAFTHTLTNPDIFSVGGGEGEAIKTVISGQNTLTVTVKKPNNGGAAFLHNTYLGDLFINVDGYNISIRLKTDLNPSDHYDTVVFTTTAKQRKFLIEKEVQYVRRAEKEAFDKKMQGIDDIARSKAMSQMGYIALNELHKVPVKYEKRLALDNNEDVTVYVDKFLDYQQYVFLKFYIENSSSMSLTVSGADVIATPRGQEGAALKTALLCDSTIHPGEHTPCVLTTQDRSILDARELTLSIATNHGPLQLTW